jgi:hypothetical protein
MPVRYALLCRKALRVVAVAMVPLLSGARSANVQAARPIAPSNALTQRYYPEVRLRKLHLVRPDLIPFPIDFDVYC